MGATPLKNGYVHVRQSEHRPGACRQVHSYVVPGPSAAASNVQQGYVKRNLRVSSLLLILVIMRNQEKISQMSTWV